MAIASTTVLASLTFYYKTEILQSVVDMMKPDVIEMFKGEVRPAVEDALLEDTFVIKLDEAQMIEIQGWIAEGDKKSAEGVMVIANKVLETKFFNYATRTYNVYNWETGDFIKKQKGVKTDTGWLMLESREQ